MNCRRFRCLFGNHDSGSYYVYVCDIDKPWEVYLVSSFLHKVVCLEWHNSGFKLLIATNNGSVEVYHMKDYILNGWNLTHKAEISGEHFCALRWLSHGFKVTLNGDKRDIASYSDKLIRENLPPSLSHFGGKAVSGWIGVTSTGLVCVGLPSNKDESYVIKTECIEHTRQRVILADIFHEKTGDIIIITSNGQLSSPVNTHRINLQLQKDECTVTVKHMNSFYVRQDSKADSHSEQITMVKLLNREGVLSVVISLGNSCSSRVELWSVSKQLATLKRAFQSASHDTKIYSYHWTQQAAVTHPSLPVSVALANFPVSYQTFHDANNKMFQYIAVAYKDGSIKIINRYTFKAIATTNLDMGFNDIDKPDKKKKVIPYIVTMQQTLTGCGLVGIDQLGCLYMMKVVNTRDTLTHVHPNYMVSVLEYLTFTGADCWDVLISIKPGVLESIIQRLSDNFLKQPVGMQEVLFQRHMAIKASVYSCSVGGGQRAADCHCRLMLHTISTHFKAQLRPKGLSAQDMGPVEKLTSNCNKNTEIDIDKVMMTLNPEKKEFVVGELTLQASQPLIQWVADLVLYLLTSLPMAQGYGTNFSGSTLMRDVPSLATLRELMVVIRIWGLINPRCLPHFTTTTANLDAMNEMFKILTRVWQAAKDNKGLDFDEGLIDKCCLLRSQIYPPNSEQALFGSASSKGYSILAQNHPIKYTFKETPTEVVSSELVRTDDHEVRHVHRVDMVHQVTLGTSPSQDIKLCSRCGNLCLADSVCKYPVVQAWEGKWLKECLCGGIWKLTSK